MYKGKKILGIILARGGSKGLPGKNIKKLLGKPLIAWSIEQGLNSKYIDKVVVSTDSKEIAKISKKYKAEIPFIRPKYLARDISSSIDSIIHALNYYESIKDKYDVIALIEPTSPLRKEKDLDNAIKKLVDNFKHSSSIISIGKIHMESPFISKIIKGKYIKPFIEKVKITRRQEIPSVYFPYGVIYAAKVSTLKKYKTFYTKKTLYYEIERWQNYEIDDKYDFICIENILKEKNRETLK